MKRMHKFLALVLCLILAFGILPAGALVAPTTGSEQSANGAELILEFASERDLARFATARGCEPLGGRMLLVRDLKMSVSDCMALPGVVSVTPNGLFEAAGLYDDAPDDTEYNAQKGLHEFGGLAAWQGIEAYATAAAITPQTVRVAVLDSGIDGTHEDLGGRVGEGFDAVTDTEIPAGANSDVSLTSHGTKVAGIIAAAAYNNKGIAGAAGQFPVELLPVRVLDENGKGSIADVIRGILWAVEAGADVILMSFSQHLDYYPMGLESAVKRATEANTLVLCAAGNGGEAIYHYYPAATIGVYPVMAFEQTRIMGNSVWREANWSNTETGGYSERSKSFRDGTAFSGPATMRTTAIGNKYESFTGTSASAAFIAGVAAGLFSVYGTGDARNLQYVTSALRDAVRGGDTSGDKARFHGASLTQEFLEEHSYSKEVTVTGEEVGERYRFTVTLPDKNLVAKTKYVVFGWNNWGMEPEYSQTITPAVAGQERYTFEFPKAQILPAQGADSYRAFYAACAFNDEPTTDENWLNNCLLDLPPEYRSVAYGGCSLGDGTPDVVPPLPDVEMPGSIIRFLDIDGNLIAVQNERGFGMESGVSRRYIDMLRSTKASLQLGIYDDGTLYLPHKVYEGDTATLQFAVENNIFLVTATKAPEQTFDGAALLHPVTVKTTAGTISLAHAELFLETPFGFRSLGLTDENGERALNLTNGTYTLYLASDMGYILRKTVTVTDATTEIDFATEIDTAVKIDVTARNELPAEGLYYVGIANPENGVRLITGMLNKNVVASVTPGTYEVSCGLYYPSAPSYWSDELHAADVLLAASTAITHDTTYDFSLSDFTMHFAIENPKEIYKSNEENLLCFLIWGETASGYILRGTAPLAEVACGDVEYPGQGLQVKSVYLLGYDAFSAGEGILVFQKGSDTVFFDDSYTDVYFGMPEEMFGTTDAEFVLRLKMQTLSQYCPELFEASDILELTIKTQAQKGRVVAIQEAFGNGEGEVNFYNGGGLYYLDENGNTVRCETLGYWDGAHHALLPESVKDGDKLLLVSGEYDRLDYCFVTYNASATEPLVFTPHTNFTTPVFSLVRGEQTYYDAAVRAFVTEGDARFELFLEGYEGRMEGYTPESTWNRYNIPAGEYTFEVMFTVLEMDEEETIETASCSIYRDLLTATISGEVYESKIDTSGFLQFGVDVSQSGLASYLPDGYGDPFLFQKNMELRYQNGLVTVLPWYAIPVTIYTDELPVSGRGELYHYTYSEIEPFSPMIVYCPFEIKANEVYKFSFFGQSLSVGGKKLFSNGENVVLSLSVLDGFGNKIESLLTALNPQGLHHPLVEKEYPFIEDEREFENMRRRLVYDVFSLYHTYPVDVYYKHEGGETGHASFASYTKLDLGALAPGRYSGVIEINMETFRDEYLVEYPFLEGIITDYMRIFNGVLRTEFDFEVSETAHEHDWSAWIDTENGQQHKRTCTGCGESEYDTHQYDSGIVLVPSTAQQEGKMEYTCTICGSKKQESIPAAEYVVEIKTNDQGAAVQFMEGNVVGFHNGTIFNVVPVQTTPSPEVVVQIEAVTADGATVLAAYELSLLRDGAEVQPDGKVKVTLPKPESTAEYERLQVVFVADDGTVTPCETIINEDGTVSFITDHFSHYAIVGVPAQSATPERDNTLLVVFVTIGAVLLVSGAVITWLFFKKKKAANA